MHKKLKKHLKKAKRSASIIIEGVLIAALFLLLGYIWFSHEFADRIVPQARVGSFSIGGLQVSDISQAMNAYERVFGDTPITITFRGMESRRTFRELGIELEKEETAQRVRAVGRGLSFRRAHVVPAVVFHDEVALAALHADFASDMVVPQNPTFAIDPNGAVRTLPAKSGENIDMISLNRDIEEALTKKLIPKIHASAVHATPTLSLEDVEPTRVFAEGLLATGFHIVAPDSTIDVPSSRVAQMIVFTSDAQPRVQFHEDALREYITETVVPSVQKDPINARFEIVDEKVTQFASPEYGRALDVEGTITAIQDALSSRTQSATAAVREVPPLVAGTNDSEKLGITSLLARGESDFKGSPKNRTNNVHVGASRYHGILIAPNEEFSFNALLGPVTREAGYLPELVIKNNMTTPEFGGGLCQVSSTVFRAAVQSGMKITSRRNHSYAVRYYGTPGFDATIYPPYTDFRFLNNTPGYILIQVKIEGTKLFFEFWGTNDNRSVEVDGPHPYDYKPDGSVKSILKQKVIRNGETIIEDTFRSNYKSPNLFPHA